MKKETWKKCIRIAAVTLLTIVLVLNVTTAVLSKVDLRDRLEWMPFAALTVQGGSMDPVMESGDLIIVNKRPYESLEIGDDVTFFTDLGFITHRIVDVRDGEFVTKGLSNEIDDIYTMGDEEYCGKVVATVPLLGHVFGLLSGSYLAVAVCAFALLVGCFGGPIVCKLRAVYTEQRQKSEKKISMPTRVLACASLLSILLCMPYVTDTKYIAQINRFEMAVAQPLYFSSNYLGEGNGNKYSILGWNGKPYSFNLQIRNYDNELLFNEDNIDVRYGIGTKIYTEGYNSDYTIDISIPSDATSLTDFAYPQHWTQDGITSRAAYQITGGEKKRQDFRVSIKPTGESGALPPEAKIYFEIYATTEWGKDYAIQLLGSFEMTVAASTKFIGETQTHELDTMIMFNVKTNLINDGVNEKVILFSWDPQSLYINEYQSTAFNVINNHPNYYSKADGRLWMKVQAFSNIDLEFFKKNLDTDGDGIDDITPDYRITVVVVDQVGSTTVLEEADQSGDQTETP